MQRIVDHGAKGASFGFTQFPAKERVRFFADDAGAIIEDVLKRLILAMQVAHEMLCPLG